MQNILLSFADIVDRLSYYESIKCLVSINCQFIGNIVKKNFLQDIRKQQGLRFNSTGFETVVDLTQEQVNWFNCN